MTPHGPRKAFYYPARDDICWVPFSNTVYWKSLLLSYTNISI